MHSRCIRECETRSVLKKCHCRDAYMPGYTEGECIYTVITEVHSLCQSATTEGGCSTQRVLTAEHRTHISERTSMSQFVLVFKRMQMDDEGLMLSMCNTGTPSCTDRQTDRWTDRQTDRQKDRQTVSQSVSQ